MMKNFTSSDPLGRPELDDIIREFERYNFKHVNDTDQPMGWLTESYCLEVVEMAKELREYRPLRPRILFLDMDGVVADYDKLANERGVSLDEASKIPGFFEDIPLMPYARDCILGLKDRYDTHILSTPSWSRPESCHEKVRWLSRHFG